MTHPVETTPLAASALWSRLALLSRGKVNTLLSFSGVAVLCLTIVLPFIGVSARIGAHDIGTERNAVLQYGYELLQQLATVMPGKDTGARSDADLRTAHETQRRRHIAALPNGYDHDSWQQRAVAPVSPRMASRLSKGRGIVAAPAYSVPNLGLAANVDYTSTAAISMPRVPRQLSLEGALLAEAARLKRIAEAASLRPKAAPVKAAFVAQTVALPGAQGMPPGPSVVPPTPTRRKDDALRKAAGGKVLAR